MAYDLSKVQEKMAALNAINEELTAAEGHVVRLMNEQQELDREYAAKKEGLDARLETANKVVEETTRKHRQASREYLEATQALSVAAEPVRGIKSRTAA